MRIAMPRTLGMRTAGFTVIVSRRSSGAMHRAGYDWKSRAAQRRKPRREKSQDQRDGAQAAFHDAQIYSLQLRAKCPSGNQSQQESETRRSARFRQSA